MDINQRHFYDQHGFAADALRYSITESIQEVKELVKFETITHNGTITVILLYFLENKRFLLYLTIDRNMVFTKSKFLQITKLLA